MSRLYSILEVSENLGVDVNKIFDVLRKKKIKLENGKIPETSLDIIKNTFGIGKVKEKKSKRVPEEKPSRKYNPSAIHQYINYEELETFIELMEEFGEDLSKMPRGSVFGGLVDLVKSGILDRWYESNSLEDVVKDFYPLETDGNRIQDNIWLIEGAESYINWDEDTKEKIRELIDESRDDLSFTYGMRDINGDSAISVANFLMAIERKRFFRPEVLERFKWLANGLLLYNSMDDKLKEELVNAYEENHERVIEFSHWLFSNEMFEQIQGKVEKQIKDDNSYLTAILFAIKDNDSSFKLSLGVHQGFGRQYAAFRRMQGFKEKRDSFNIALKRIKKDIEAAMKNEKKIDVDLFIEKTIKNGTYKYFYENYCGRGIQYSTFGTYSAAALLLDSEENPENRHYGGILSKLSKERRIEKVDRLKGRNKNGKTCLVDLCKEYPDPITLHKELKENWSKYRDKLSKEGCWLGKSRKRHFTQSEVKGMYELVSRYPSLFGKNK